MIMMAYPAYALPGISENTLEFKDIEFRNKYGSAAFRIPKAGRSLARDVVVRLDAARSHLARKSEQEISNALERVAGLWLEPDFRYRRMTEEWLPVVTGFSPQMVRAFLNGMMNDMLRESCQLSLPGNSSNVERMFCILEEIPGPEVLTITMALHNKSVVFCKSPSTEPLFAALYAQSFADVDKRLADCIAVIPWEGGKPESRDMEDFFYCERTGKDAVVVFGNVDAAESIKRKTNPAARLQQFTGGISFGVIGKEMLEGGKVGDVVHSAALAVCMYDQRACFSPQLFYVERGGDTLPEKFAELLAGEMQELETALPRGDLSLDASATLTELMSTYELQDLLGSVKLYGVKNGGEQVGAVVYQEDSKFETSCLYRVIRVKPVDKVIEVPKLVGSSPSLEYLHTAGVALSDEREEELERALKKLGVDRVVSLNNMYQPSFSEYRLFG